MSESIVWLIFAIGFVFGYLAKGKIYIGTDRAKYDAAFIGVLFQELK